MSTNVQKSSANAPVGPANAAGREPRIHLHQMWAAIAAAWVEGAEPGDLPPTRKMEATVHSDDIDIYYERSGTGLPLLFINGSGATLAGSSGVVGMYAAHFDVVAHDQRGLGRTTVPSGPYTMAEYTTDAAAVAKAVGWERYRVVGTSFGGMVAQELAIRFPGRIERLALVCTSPGGSGRASYPLHTLHDGTAAGRAEIGPQILDTRFTPEWLETHESDRALVEMMADHGSTTVEKSVDVLHGERLQLDARSFHDVYDRLGGIACPTFVASGRYDGLAPAANSRAIAERVPDAELRLYEGGHAFFIQDRRALPDIVEFLSR